MLSEPIDSEAIIPGCVASKYDILLVIKKMFYTKTDYLEGRNQRTV